jgi:hypothetical protein
LLAKGGSMTGIGFVALLTGVAITFTLQNWLNARWYVSILSGVIGYLVVICIGWAIKKRQRHNREKERDPIVK